MKNLSVDGKILVLENETSTIETLTTVLERHNYKVKVAESGLKGFSMAQKEKFDLILLNALMSEPSGYEICQKLKQEKETSDIPIIFMSSHLNGLDKEEVFSVGAADYITHPLIVDELLARVSIQVKLHQLECKLKHADTKHAQEQLQLKNTEVVQAKDALNKSNKELHNSIKILQKSERELRIKNESLIAAEAELQASNDALRENIENLNKSEAKLSAVQKMFKIGHYNLDFEAGIWSSSDELDAIFGIDEDFVRDVEGWLAVVHPDYKLQMAEYFQNEIVNKKKQFNKEYKILNLKTNQERWVHGLGELSFDKSGTLKHMLGSIQDITERKITELKIEQANAELEAERDLLQNLMDNVPDTIYFKDIESRFTRVNTAQAKLLGAQSPEDTIGKTDFDFFKKEHAVEADRDEKKIIRTKKPLINKVEILTKPDNTTRWVSTTKVPVFDATNKVVGLIGLTRDINDQVEMQRKLAESQERYELATNATLDGIWDWNLLTNKIYFSPRWKSMLGYRDDELPNDPKILNNLTHPDDFKKARLYHKEHVEGKGERFECEIRMKHKNGQWVQILSRGNALFDENKKAIRIIGTHVDLTEIKKIEQELRKKNEILVKTEEELLISNEALQNNLEMLRESESRYKALHNSTFGGIIIHDNGIILEVNAVMCEMSGYTRNELIGMNGLLLIAEEYRPVVIEKINEGYVQPYEIVGRRKDGTTGYLRVEGKMIPYKGKEVRVIEFRDITQRKINERRIIESEARFKGLFEHMQSGVTIYKPIKNNSDFEFVSFNKAAERITLLKSEDLIGKSLLTLFPQIVESPVLDALKEVNETGKDIYLEPYYYADVVRNAWQETSIYKLPSGEIVATFDDVSDKVESEEKIRQSEKRFRTLAENSPGVIYLCKNDTRYSTIYLNEKVEELIGYSKELFLNNELSFVELYHPDDAERIMSEIDSALSKKESFHLTYRLKNSNNEWRWIEEYGAGIFNDEELLFIEGTLMDITEEYSQEIINDTRLKVADYASVHHSNELLTYVLDQVETLTQSKISFFHFVDEGSETYSLQALSTRTAKLMGGFPKPGKNTSFSKAGVWLDCIRERKTIIHNDYKSLKHKKGLPKGHADVVRELLVPVVRNKKIVAILGVGNKKENYNDIDTKLVEQLADMAIEIVLRKKTEESLKENEKQLQLIFDNSPAIMVLLDNDARILKVNRTGLSFLQHTPENVYLKQIGHLFNCIEYCKAKDCTSGFNCKSCSVRHLIEKIINTHKPEYKVEASLNVISEDKPRSLNVLVSTTIATTVPKKTYLVTIDDITERKQSELKLKESELRFRTIIESANDAIIIAEADTGKIVDFNKRATELTGAPRENLLGVHHTRLYPEEDREKRIISFNRNADTRENIATLEVDIQHIEGKRIPVEISPALLKLDNNKEFMVGFFRDITNRKEAEFAIQESRERFKQLADTATEGIIIHSKGKIVDVNKSILELTKYTEDELIFTDVNQKIIPKKFWPIITETMRHSNPPPFEIEIKNKLGKAIPVEVRARSISKSKNSLRVISVRDITAQKQMQQKILQAIISTEEQERKRVAQELHDGIGPILSTVKLYTETYFKSDNEEFKEKIKHQLMISINEALKQISVISNNLSPHVLDDFGLKAAIEKFIEKFKNVNKIDFDFSYSLESNVKKEIETTLYRVCIELINNSLKHAESTVVKISIYEKEGKVYMQYSDNGTGFDFEMVKRGKGGMGLFNIVNRVKSLNGNVDFRNKKQGIQYDFEIPL